MKQYKAYDGSTRLAYEAADIISHLIDIQWAGELWSELCADYVREHGDKGTCVLGAGIVVDYIKPGKRTPERLMILAVPRTAAQGSLTWEASTDEVVARLKANGIEARYHPGYMD